MTGSRWIGPIAMVTAVGLTTGCSTTEPTPTGVSFPARPATVDVSRSPPCDLLTDTQRAGLELGRGRPGTANVNGRSSPACTWLGDGAVDYNAQFIPIDAEEAATEPEAKIITINGFGAVQSIPTMTFGGTPFCQVTVDVADGQTIRVQANTRPFEPPIGIQEQCRRAADTASMIMTTVVAATAR